MCPGSRSSTPTGPTGPPRSPSPTRIRRTADTICSVFQLDLSRTKGQQTFQNVTKDLLYVYAILPRQTTLSRVPLFDSRLQDFFWNYDNNGLKNAQFRFYPIST